MGVSGDGYLIQSIDDLLSVLKEAGSEAESGDARNAACRVSVAMQIVERLRRYHLQESLNIVLPGLIKKSDPPLSVRAFTDRLHEIGYVFLAEKPGRTVRTALNRLVDRGILSRPTDGRYILPGKAGSKK